MEPTSLLERLTRRKVWQWAVAYLGVALAIGGLVEFSSQPWGISQSIQRNIHIILITGFFLTLVLAWFHGEKGRQRVSGPEAVLLAVVVLAGGVSLPLLGVREDGDSSSEGLEGAEGVGSGGVGGSSTDVTLAVLPLENRSGPEIQGFTDQMHDEVTTALSRTPGLEVRPRTSVERYRGATASMRTIGEELEVDYLLEGGLFDTGEDLRVTLQLIDPRQEGHIWADTYTWELDQGGPTDILSEIVSTVAAQLSLSLRREEADRAVRRTTDDPDAYRLFLMADDAYDETLEGYQRAISYFQRALERDPGFLMAQVQLAHTHSYWCQFNAHLSPTCRSDARGAALRAMEMDSTSVDAQFALGEYLFRHEKDNDAALELFERAAGTLTHDYDYRRLRAYAERASGRWEAAIATFQAAIDLNPMDCWAPVEMGYALQILRRLDDAEAAFQLVEARAERWNPGFSQHLIYLSRIDRMRGEVGPASGRISVALPDSYFAWRVAMDRHDWDGAREVLALDSSDFSYATAFYPRPLVAAWTESTAGEMGLARDFFTEAVENLEARVTKDPENPLYRDVLGLAYAGLGRAQEAIREGERAVELPQIERSAIQAPRRIYFLAAIHAQLGDVEAAVQILDRTMGIPSEYTSEWVENDFLFASIREDPRFKELMEKHRGQVF